MLVFCASGSCKFNLACKTVFFFRTKNARLRVMSKHGKKLLCSVVDVWFVVLSVLLPWIQSNISRCTVLRWQSRNELGANEALEAVILLGSFRGILLPWRACSSAFPWSSLKLLRAQFWCACQLLQLLQLLPWKNYWKWLQSTARAVMNAWELKLFWVHI